MTAESLHTDFTTSPETDNQVPGDALPNGAESWSTDAESPSEEFEPLSEDLTSLPDYDEMFPDLPEEEEDWDEEEDDYEGDGSYHGEGEFSEDDDEDYGQFDDTADLEEDFDEEDWQDVLHIEVDSEPEQLAMVEALAARLSKQEDEEEPEPIWREDIEVVQALCTRPFHTGCDRCAAVCPHDAIVFDGEDAHPRIIDERCTNCGLCAGICDGFSSVRIMLTDLADKALRIAEDGTTVTFACNDMIPLGEEPADHTVLLPCLAAVPPEFWTSLLLEDASVKLCCDFDQCAACEAAGSFAPQLLDHAVSTAEAWSKKKIGFVDVAPTQESLLAELAQGAEAGSDRRNMLSGITSTLTDVATGERRARTTSSVLAFRENMERMRANGHINQHEGATLEELISETRLRKYWPRRELMARVLQDDPDHREDISFWTSDTDESLCSGTHTCVEACPTGARQIADDGSIDFDGRYCIACGACMAACPTGACDFVEVTANELFNQSPEED